MEPPALRDGRGQVIHSRPVVPRSLRWAGGEVRPEGLPQAGHQAEAEGGHGRPAAGGSGSRAR
eukprot:15469221-Alexandrium_andersonii.AAC.1